jgi:two-component system, NtrC family, sensor histidine kinase GlrK
VELIIGFAIALIAAGVLIILQRRRIDLLQRENRRLSERALQVTQMKKDFISHVSHELKAPLASMQETTHIMIEKIPGPLTEKQARLLDLNLQSGKRLAVMIGNMLDLSRLEAGIVEYDMQNQNMAELVQSVLGELTVQLNEKTARLVTDIQSGPIIVECDSNRMVQLFTNLIENALMFSKRDGIIQVKVASIPDLPERIPESCRKRLARSDNHQGYALIAISDCGPGIEDDHKERIFEEFHQVKQGRKILGQGLGLGLAISRSVIEAHRGTIWVEDNPAGGSVFLVLLPKANERAETLQQAS